MKWWSKKWGNDKICSITHSRLRPGRDKHGIPYVYTTECGHTFYTQALLNWAKYCVGKATCPYCRSSIDPLQIFIQNIPTKL